MAKSDIGSAASLANALISGPTIATPFAGASLAASLLGLKGPFSMGGRDRGTRGSAYYDPTTGISSKPNNKASSGQLAKTEAYAQSISDLIAAEFGTRNVDPTTLGKLPGLSFTETYDPGNIGPLSVGGPMNISMTSPGGRQKLPGTTFSLGNPREKRGVDKGYFSDIDSLNSAVVQAYVNQAINPNEGIDYGYKTPRPTPITGGSGGMFGNTSGGSGGDVRQSSCSKTILCPCIIQI